MYDELLYRRISQLRLAKGVSARDMSLSIGQNENYINIIENKKNLPSMSGFFYICEYFGITPREFFDEELESPGLNRELQQRFKKLSPAQAEHLIAIMDDILM